MLTEVRAMSESKRSNSEYAASVVPPGMARPAMPGIDESQPQPALEMTRAMSLLLEGPQERGGDPYNAVGRSARP